MVVGDDVVNDGHLPMNQPNINGQNDDSMNQSSLEMMESIIQRLQPQNRHEIRDMIFHRGRISGAMLIMAILLWWISVEKGAERLGDSAIPISQLGGFEFAELSLIVPSIALFATLVMSIGRERGNAVLSNLAGILVILGAFYILEPFGNLVLGTGDMDLQNALFASGRLTLLALLLHFATRFFFEALLLQWVRTWLLSNDIDVFSSNEQNIHEGHTDEETPLA
ncbi:MAG: hypothetical protein CL962_05125 [Euryarchaeota archaeon]|jgi:hypothetical protein|nr:hypothetical protein [Euryarchaeota archaeon]MAP65847.1 hypothetical protein [Euryarchaeota archaeon]|tara:strand:- start:1417 stop:2088 length:672 start_codon:yes stop_codon:yes gene_type:complete